MQLSDVKVKAPVHIGDIIVKDILGTGADVVVTSDKGIINWKSFNIGGDEKVKFIQPGLPCFLFCI